METTEELNIRLSFSKKSVLPLLAIFFLCWHPGFIGSESLTLTTYYPAPYGGYVSILTTGRTILSRDADVVGIGTPSPAANIPVRSFSGASNLPLKLDLNGSARLIDAIWAYSAATQSGGALVNDQGGAMELGGGVTNGTPYIDFHRTATEDFSARLILSQAGRLTVDPDLSVTKDLYVGRDLLVAAGGRLRGLCYTKSYIQGGTTFCDNPTNERVITWYGNAAPTCGMLFRGGNLETPGNWSQQVCVGEDKSGTMVCCRIEW